MREQQFSAMVNQFQPGIFTALNDKKEEMIQAGKRVFNLSVGTPDFAPAPHVMEATYRSVQRSGRTINMHWQICRSF